MPHDAKTLGAYFTLEVVADALVRWAVRRPDDFLLDPSSGDGRFVARNPKSVGIERDPTSVAAASDRAPCATVVHDDFFTWATADRRRFDCPVGNPPEGAPDVVESRWRLLPGCVISRMCSKRRRGHR